MVAPHHQTRHAPRPGLLDSEITHATLVASTIVIHNQHIPRQGFPHGLQENVYTSSMTRWQDPTSDTHFWDQRMYARWGDAQRDLQAHARIGDKGGRKIGKSTFQQSVG